MLLTAKQLKEKMRAKTVGIAGLGGLGSNLAVALARAGIGKLIMVDYDCVEITNLNRQYYFQKDIGKPKAEALKQILLAIDPEVELEVHNLKIDAQNCCEIFKNVDYLAECFDKAESKAILTRSFLQKLAPLGQKMVVASGMAGWSPITNIKQSKINASITMVGDQFSDVESESVLLASRVITTAMYQCHTIIEWIIRGE